MADERWEQLTPLFLRSVEVDFSLGELREALGSMGAKAPNDGILAPWLRDRGWDSSRKIGNYNVRWKRQEGCLDVPKSDKLSL